MPNEKQFCLPMIYRAEILHESKRLKLSIKFGRLLAQHLFTHLTLL